MCTFILASLVICQCSACGTASNMSAQSAESIQELSENVQTEPSISDIVEENHDNAVTEEKELLAAMENGDFSYFAGTYKPCSIYNDWYGGGEDLPNLILNDNGIIIGGLVYGAYPETEPISVTQYEDGSYQCQVSYLSNQEQAYFLIYPEGVIGENPYAYDDPLLTETPYIQYLSIDGGVSDIIYYKIEEE